MQAVRIQYRRVAAAALGCCLALTLVHTPGSHAGDGQSAAVRVKMKTSLRVAPAKGKKVRYVGRVKAAKEVKVRGKHLPAGVSKGGAKSAGREACLRDWRTGYGSITVRSGASTLGSDTNLSDKLKWSVKARRASPVTASGPQLFAPVTVNGKTFSAQCTQPRNSL